MAVEPVPLTAADEWSPKVISARFEVESLLGRGGMGTVYRVRDRHDGRALALKRLSVGRGSRVSMLAQFEREYATLAQLSHPRIIEVYDYGSDGDAAYYTMELLDGADLSVVSPLPYLRACRYLRDVATSLALLHVRKLVHRDVTPRNVHLGRDDQCKLLDFGALLEFGESASVIGTPPCIAPEAFEAEGLDQRADLYSLGCLAYFMLTGRHAYPATHIGQLPSYWAQTILPPSAAKPEVGADGQPLPPLPAALDELVLWLLRADRSARPASAGVVIDRLNVLLGDESPDLRSELGLAESHLASAPLVGRDRELEEAGQHIQQLQHGRGHSTMLEGSQGAGKSRLLRRIALQARLRVLPVVQVDAAKYERGYECASALCREVLRVVPQASAIATRFAETLGALLPEVASGPVEISQVREDDPLWHSRTQSALRDFVLEVAAQQSLVIVVDNLQCCERPSAVFVAALGQESRRHPIYLITGCTTGGEIVEVRACDALRQASTVHTLGGLTEPAVRRWFEALFGDATSLPRLSQAVHARTAGHPAESLELLRALLYGGEIRYQQGTWMLPLEPASLIAARAEQESLRSRIAALSPGARSLAHALTLYRGTLTHEICGALCAATSIVVMRKQLDELVRLQLLSRSQRAFSFTHESVRQALIAEISDDDRARLRQGIAELFLRRNSPRVSERLLAGSYLLETGDARAMKLLCDGAIEISTRSQPHTACIEPLEQALALCRSRGHSLAQRSVLLAALAVSCYVVDRRLDRHAPEFFASFSQLLCVPAMRRLRPYLGPKLSMYLGLALAALRYVLQPARSKPCSFRLLVELFMTGSITLSGKAAICLDRASIEQVVATIEPLSAFGRNHEAGYAHDFCRGLALLTQERLGQTHAHWMDLERRLARPGSFPNLAPEARRLWSGGVLYVLGMFDSFAGDPRALERAAALEATEVDVNLLAGAQLRRQYHGFRGEADEVIRAQAQVEACALRAGSAWQAETFSAIVTNYFASLSNDLLTSTRAMAETKAVAVDIPSLERYVLAAQATHNLMRGKPHETITLYERMFEHEQPLERIGSSASTGLLAQAYNEIGEHARAREICEAQLKRLTPEDATYVHMLLPLHRSHLAALGALEQHGEATRRVNELIAQQARHPSPLVLGSLHETAARLAWQHKDLKAFTRHLKEVETLFCPLGNSALIARYTALTALGGADGGMAAKIATMREVRAFDATLGPLADRALLAHHIFAWLMQKCDGFRGFLVVQEAGLLVTLISSDASDPPREALDMVERSLVSLNHETVTTHIPEPQLDTHVERPALRRELQGRPGEGLHLHLLSFVEGGRFYGEGALVLCGPVGKPPRIRYDFLEVAARHLQRAHPRISRLPTMENASSPVG